MSEHTDEQARLDAIRKMEAGDERQVAVDALTPRERLRLLWLYLLHALLDNLGKPDVKASLLDVARKFLSDNHAKCALDYQSTRDGLESLASKISDFPDFN